MATTSLAFVKGPRASEAARLIPFVQGAPPVPPSSELQELVLDRLIATGASDHIWSDYVLAALQGDAELRAALDGLAPGRPQQKAKSTDDTGKPVEPPGVFVSSIAVAGFRGIGPPTTLPLKLGPGPATVVGHLTEVLAVSSPRRQG